jgi:Ni,Fe-hydrogenase III component G
METTQMLDAIEKVLKPFSQSFNRPSPERLDAVVKPEDLKAAVKAMVDAKWLYLSAITGLDIPAPADQPDAEGHVEALYHFCEGEAVATLRVSVPYSRPVFPSVCEYIPSATLGERELMEMFGVVVDNTPNSDRLVLPEDWPQGVYPLRKSFTGFNKG